MSIILFKYQCYNQAEQIIKIFISKWSFVSHKLQRKCTQNLSSKLIIKIMMVIYYVTILNGKIYGRSMMILKIILWIIMNMLVHNQHIIMDGLLVI